MSTRASADVTRQTYTPDECAAVLGISVRQLRRLVRDGLAPDPLPWPGRPKWSRREVDRWLESADARRGIRRRAG